LLPIFRIDVLFLFKLNVIRYFNKEDPNLSYIVNNWITANIFSNKNWTC